MSIGTDTVVGRLVQRVRAAVEFQAADQEKVRVVLADALAVALAARTSPTGRSLARMVESDAEGPATSFLDGRRVSVATAVLANSALVHDLLLDDAHAPTMLHPGSVVIPVALAVAEERGSSGAELVGAVVAGYDAMIAAAAPVARDAVARGLRNTPLFGGIGAATVAGVLLGLDDERLAAAILIGAGNAGGTMQALRNGSPEWRFQGGLAALSGLAAARLAAALEPDLLPFVSSSIESPAGLYPAIAGVPDVDWRKEFDALAASSPFQAVTHKKYASCGANQVAIGALRTILGRRPVDPTAVVSIDASVTRAAYDFPGCASRGPFTSESALLSRPFALAATVLAEGAPLRLEQLRAALSDERLVGLVDRVHSHLLPDRHVRHEQSARVVVTFVDGTVMAADDSDVDPAELRPDWTNAQQRLREAAEESLGSSAADGLVQAIAALPSAAPRSILDRFARPSTAEDLL
ncbi:MULTISPECIES: MmgE/PrpD family protein [unclassified Modestobacter]